MHSAHIASEEGKRNNKEVSEHTSSRKNLRTDGTFGERSALLSGWGVWLEFGGEQTMRRGVIPRSLKPRTSKYHASKESTFVFRVSKFQEKGKTCSGIGFLCSDGQGILFFMAARNDLFRKDGHITRGEGLEGELNPWWLYRGTGKVGQSLVQRLFK